jgi:hypothetical protein
MTFYLHDRIQRKKSVSLLTNFERMEEENDDSIVEVSTYFDFIPDINLDETQMKARIRSILSTGNSWVEMLRLLIAEKYRFVMAQYHDPLGECEFIANELLHELDILYSKLNRKYKTADAKQQEISRVSIGLSTIINEIHAGYYDEHSKETAVRIPGYQPKQSVDVFHASLGRWVEGTVVEVTLGGARVHYGGLGDDCDEKVELRCLAPFQSRSADKVPTELIVLTIYMVRTE